MPVPLRIKRLGTGMNFLFCFFEKGLDKSEYLCYNIFHGERLFGFNFRLLRVHCPVSVVNVGNKFAAVGHCFYFGGCAESEIAGLPLLQSDILFRKIPTEKIEKVNGIAAEFSPSHYLAPILKAFGGDGKSRFLIKLPDCGFKRRFSGYHRAY